MTNIHRINFNPANQSAFGSLETAEMTPVIQGDFVYGLNNQIWDYNYYFTVTAPASPPVVGDVYSNNNNYFTVVFVSGTTFIASGTGVPTASGNLTRVTGAGTTPIAYSAYTLTIGVSIGTGATIDTNASRLRVQSGTTSTGFSYIQTRRPVRYRAGQGTTARFTPLFTSGSASSIQLWGMGDVSGSAITDGYFFGYNGASFGIAHYNSGSATWYARATDWNGDKVDGSAGSSFNWDPTKGTPVMIKYPFLGYGDIAFYVQNPSNAEWALVHVIQYANTTASVQLTNPTMHFMGYTANTGSTTNKTLYCGSVGVFISGMKTFIGNAKGAFEGYLSSTSTEAIVMSLRSANKYNGASNRGLVRLNSCSVSNSGNTTAFVIFKVNASFGTTPVFTPISGTTADNGATITSGNSFVSVDTAGGTVTASTGFKIFNIQIGPSSNQFIDLVPYELYFAPGEVLNVTGRSIANSNVGVSLNWSEDI